MYTLITLGVYNVTPTLCCSIALVSPADYWSGGYTCTHETPSWLGRSATITGCSIPMVSLLSLSRALRRVVRLSSERQFTSRCSFCIDIWSKSHHDQIYNFGGLRYIRLHIQIMNVTRLQRYVATCTQICDVIKHK